MVLHPLPAVLQRLLAGGEGLLEVHDVLVDLGLTPRPFFELPFGGTPSRHRRTSVPRQSNVPKAGVMSTSTGAGRPMW